MKELDFVFIGSDKAGSTWLFNFLKSHNEVFVPAAKDLYYFDKYYQLGERWYQRQFRLALKGQKIGEVCHDYILSPLASERIFRHSPNAKIIVFYRDHASRSFSHYKYLNRSGRSLPCLASAIERYDEIIDNSLVGKHLINYSNIFPGSNIFVFNFELLKTDPHYFAEQVCSVLGVNMSELNIIQSDWDKRSAQFPRSILLAKTFKICAFLLRRFGFAGLVGRAKHHSFFSHFYKFDQENGKEEDTSALKEYSSRFKADAEALFQQNVNFIGF